MSVEISDVGGVDGPSVRTTACFVAGVEEPSDSALALREEVSLRNHHADELTRY